MFRGEKNVIYQNALTLEHESSGVFSPLFFQHNSSLNQRFIFSRQTHWLIYKRTTANTRPSVPPSVRQTKSYLLYSNFSQARIVRRATCLVYSLLKNSSRRPNLIIMHEWWVWWLTNNGRLRPRFSRQSVVSPIGGSRVFLGLLGEEGVEQQQRGRDGKGRGGEMLMALLLEIW